MDSPECCAGDAVERVKCPCFSGSGKPLKFGALPKSLGFGRLGNEARALLPANIVALKKLPVAPVVLSKSVAQNVATAGALMKQGVQPTPNQAVNIIKTVIPPAAGFKPNLKPPLKSGNKSSANLGSVTGRTHYRSQYYGMSFGRLSGPTTIVGAASTVGGAVAGAEAGALYGSVVPGIGTIVGVAVGAIIGLIGGLFGHKKAIPHVSAQDIANAQAWEQQYVQVAGSVIGRNFNASAINDMITAMAINNPGFWGFKTSGAEYVPDVSNFIQEEFARLRYFLSAVAAVKPGQEVTLTDIPSLPGHGKTNLNVSYSFLSPGITAPSYVLGAYFAQYFFTMCTIFQPPANCAGHLTAPFPQMHCDILDYVRSSNAAWDTPQPAVVTGADVSIAAPTITQEGSAEVATATATTLAPMATCATTVAAPIPTAPPTATIPATQITPSIVSAPVPIAKPTQTAPATAGSISQAGFSGIGLGLLALVGIPMLFSRKK